MVRDLDQHPRRSLSGLPGNHDDVIPVAATLGS
jgi:hypothetical protein